MKTSAIFDRITVVILTVDSRCAAINFFEYFIEIGNITKPYSSNNFVNGGICMGEEISRCIHTDSKNIFHKGCAGTLLKYTTQIGWAHPKSIGYGVDREITVCITFAYNFLN